MTTTNINTISATNNNYVTTLGDMLNWVTNHRTEYVEEIATEFLHSSKRVTFTCGNWSRGVDWHDEETRRHLFELRVYDDTLKLTRKALEKRLVSFTDNVCDSKRMSRDIADAIRNGNYTTATFRCGRVKIILVEVG